MSNGHTILRKGIAIGGIRGGSGKTLISIGIIKTLQRRGFRVAPFKKGPDYIDPAWLTLSSQMRCHNLDTFLMERQQIFDSFSFNNPDSDFIIVEGNRGLFDGVDIEGTHSFSELVKMLGIPLILIIDCTKSSRSVAAILHGFKTFDKDLRISAVILNYLAGERHKKLITESIEKYCRIPVLGAIPKLSSLSILERHLGLITVHEQQNAGQVINDVGEIIGKNIDIDGIIRLAEARQLKIEKGGNSDFAGRNSIRAESLKNQIIQDAPVLQRINLGIIRDSAFNFYYPENIEELEKAGARIIELNSLTGRLNENIDALYIGGGFPETHAEMISKNCTMRKKIKQLIEKGLPVYAECGGLVYLSNSIIIDGKKYRMAGVFPFVFEISESPVGHGYSIFEVDKPNPYYPVGSTVRGHQFRYSKIVNSENTGEYTTVFKMQRGSGISDGREGILYKNTLATFIHTHALTMNVTWTHSIIELAKRNTGNHWKS